MELLIKYQEYAPDGKVPAYQFDLGKDPQASAWLDQHQLDEVLSGKTDVELMKAGLFWVCEEYDHSSYSQYRGDDSLDSVGVYADTGKGLNCNNLSVLLSGILRNYRVKAVPSGVFRQVNGIKNVMSSFRRTANSWISGSSWIRPTI